MDEPLVLTVPQAAAALQISMPAAYRMVADGRLPVVRLGPKSTRVPLDALRAQLAASTLGSDARTAEGAMDASRGWMRAQLTGTAPISGRRRGAAVDAHG